MVYVFRLHCLIMHTDGVRVKNNDILLLNLVALTHNVKWCLAIQCWNNIKLNPLYKNRMLTKIAIHNNISSLEWLQYIIVLWLSLIPQIHQKVLPTSLNRYKIHILHIFCKTNRQINLKHLNIFHCTSTFHQCLT